MPDEILIIGAGIAGLATGCYAQMNGYQVRILEAHRLPGGLCTAWSRQGYTFDGCIHHLAGSGPASWLYRVWQELGATQERAFLFPEDLVRIEAPDGQALTIYTDIERLAEHMHTTWPGDRAAIDTYLAAARRFRQVDLLSMMAAPRDWCARCRGRCPCCQWMPVT
jgi:phytoene dehydrogenase-like protein